MLLFSEFSVNHSDRGSLQTILTLHYVSQQMGGQAYRISGLLDTVIDLAKERAELQSDVFQEGDGIAFSGVDVFTPNGKQLVKDLNFELKAGGSLLLTGHNGAGKSSIFRCLGGLWSVKTGLITKPGGAAAGLADSVFYLPQKPYNVLGSLSDQITYPKPDAVVLSAEQLRDILGRVSLLHLLEESSAAVRYRHCLALVFSLTFFAKTLPLPCGAAPRPTAG